VWLTPDRRRLLAIQVIKEQSQNLVVYISTLTVQIQEGRRKTFVLKAGRSRKSPQRPSTPTIERKCAVLVGAFNCHKVLARIPRPGSSILRKVIATMELNAAQFKRVASLVLGSTDGIDSFANKSHYGTPWSVLANG
jgi:hypothetical protein